MTTGTELRHCRVCDEAALADRGVKTMTRDVFGVRPRGLLRGRGTMDPAELRRRWGVAMSLRAFAEFGVLGEAAEILAVGPDCDEAVRWLSQRAKWVFATDPVSEGEPPLNPRRVVVQEMAPTELRYEDGSMDALIAPAAFDRLESLGAARAAAAEMHRVIKPGGVAAITVGLALEGSPTPPILDQAALRAVFLADDLSWAISDPLDPRPAGSSAASREGERVWTSVHLLLVKPLYH